MVNFQYAHTVCHINPWKLFRNMSEHFHFFIRYIGQTLISICLLIPILSSETLRNCFEREYILNNSAIIIILSIMLWTRCLWIASLNHESFGCRRAKLLSEIGSICESMFWEYVKLNFNMSCNRRGLDKLMPNFLFLIWRHVKEGGWNYVHLFSNAHDSQRAKIRTFLLNWF